MLSRGLGGVIWVILEYMSAFPDPLRHRNCPSIPPLNTLPSASIKSHIFVPPSRGRAPEGRYHMARCQPTRDHRSATLQIWSVNDFIDGETQLVRLGGKRAEGGEAAGRTGRQGVSPRPRSSDKAADSRGRWGVQMKDPGELSQDEPQTPRGTALLWGYNAQKDSPAMGSLWGRAKVGHICQVQPHL